MKRISKAERASKKMPSILHNYRHLHVIDLNEVSECDAGILAICGALSKTQVHKPQTAASLKLIT